MRTIIIMLIMWLGAVTMSAQTSYDAATVYRTVKQGKHVKICEVKYYVNEDTLFTNQRFRHIGFIYSDNKTNKMVLMQKSLLFDTKHRKGSWYYVVFDKSSVKCPAGTYVSAVAFRDCLYGIDPDSKHRCADAYLYNITEEIPSWKGSTTMPHNIQKLKKFF